jgi:hypothetical protein
VHRSSRFSDHVFVADADCDVAAYHLEGLIPRMAVRRRSAAFRAFLAEDFVTSSSRTGCKNRDLLPDDIKRGGSGRGCDNERFWHKSTPLCLFWILTSGRRLRPSGRHAGSSRIRSIRATLALSAQHSLRSNDCGKAFRRARCRMPRRSAT